MNVLPAFPTEPHYGPHLGQCPHCDTDLHGYDDPQLIECDHPGCKTGLCRKCRTACWFCGNHFCDVHLTAVEEHMLLCSVCLPVHQEDMREMEDTERALAAAVAIVRAQREKITEPAGKLQSDDVIRYLERRIAQNDRRCQSCGSIRTYTAEDRDGHELRICSACGGKEPL